MTGENTKNTNYETSRKIETREIPRSFSENLIYSRKNTLFIEDEFFADKEESALDIIFFPKDDDEIEEKKEETINGKNYDKIEDKKKEIKVEMEDEKIKKEEKNEEKKEIKKEERKEVIENVQKIKNVNNINNVNTINNLTIISKKKSEEYSQNYSRKDFKDRPPSISSLFLHEYNYENKNIFSHSNETNGDINEKEMIPNIFYNHLLINKTKGRINVTTSMNQRNLEKLLTVIYYIP